MLAYIFIYPIMWLINRLSIDGVYRVADFAAWLMRDVIGYRKKVVYHNLRNAFPEKSEQEIQQYMREFYTHLADRFLEHVKAISISNEELIARTEIYNRHWIEDAYDANQHIVLMGTHCAGWEWAGYSATLQARVNLWGIYNPIGNQQMNNLFLRSRARWNFQWVRMKDSGDALKQQHERPLAMIFMSDQSPSNPANAYWTTFLGRDTCFWWGGARFAKKHNLPMVYLHISQRKRGYFKIDVRMLCENPADFTEGQLVELYARELEKQLRECPSDWLWSHRRWKHSRPTSSSVSQSDTPS